ncbi:MULTISPECIES: ferrous iron transport protein B [unclassified Mucilaginibacter]|uniref:ferrous iron transport protein B n=1 Tax=unclassified Mucilaginibacter TaxID=2617802 RepID=UPI002AC93B1F|nr:MULTISPECIES: ferrous iron transport protein B [unclassified Mucilaginibacter]MEB0262001.1 ferrous iron transport protein B [Mucilaginibacter sp. 10I4]MEB0279735.1 ferrous iron transport protein B [Mucilaginibacter sp. 10B2]MEB0301672.1 ferrous iron transport protein B [Mucilaginibacter sp. 5C4]WPX23706.1 ferrous iron transport protein B [Mucilaginibacter sp. 5C4]
MKADIRVALVGNPNTGKSTLFNALTGLNQKIGNFPGVTVDKKIGYSQLPDGRRAEIIDLPGTYSLYPKSRDESIVFSVLAEKNTDLTPDLVIVIIDATNLKRNLLLYTQVADLKIPVIIALNMMDMAKKAGISIEINKLAEKLGVPIITVSARKLEGIDELKTAISYANKFALQQDSIDVNSIAPGIIESISKEFGTDNPYFALQLAHQHETLKFLTPAQSERIEELEKEHGFHTQKAQASETIARYNYINDLLYDTVKTPVTAHDESISNKIDKVLTHRVFGFVIFIGVLLFMFQSIFAWSAYPMSLIEDLFVWIQGGLRHVLPTGPLADLLIDGVVAGLSGVMVFIPQIAILFAFISILEDTGYMSRVTFMMDKIMRKVGLNGKSVVPLIGGFACAVPSIMSTRTIENWKDRMITIMVTPLVTCSARLPVYTLLIALVVPNKNVWWIFNLQGLALTGMYVLSLVSAVIVAYVMKFVLKARERGYFIMELPVYRMPRWSNVLFSMYERAKTFVLEAGKVIIAVSVILWVLSSYGPGDRFKNIEQKYQQPQYTKTMTSDSLKRVISTEKLENSYAGVLGHVIEPVIKPIGFDWKIGIALITSFAAREVFVGTMATIYSVDGDADRIDSVQDKMRNARNPNTGGPVFTLAVAFSLMMFYAFAMQCASTVAVVYRETKDWRWPAAQFAYMTILAYGAAFLVYHLLK